MDSKDEQVRAYVIDDTHPMDQLDPTGVLVKPKWRGTSQDKTDMEVLGRHQVLRVSRIVVAAHELLLTSTRETFDSCPCLVLEAP